MLSTWNNLLTRRDLLRELTVSELKSTSAETKLGWVWWVLDPLLLMLIYWAVVVGILGRGHDYHPYPLFVLCGLLPWNHLSSSANKSVRVLAQRESLIKSVPFPTMALPLSLVLARLVYLVIGLVVLLAAVAIWKRLPTPAVVQLPFLVMLQVVLVSGFCLMLSVYGVVAPDLGTALYYILRIFFYASPIIYGADLVHEKLAHAAHQGHWWAPVLQNLYFYNPMAILIAGYREALFYGRFLGAHHWIVLAVEALVIFVGGYFLYQHYDRRVIKFI